jgi:hypothetical protein
MLRKRCVRSVTRLALSLSSGNVREIDLGAEEVEQAGVVLPLPLPVSGHDFTACGKTRLWHGKVKGHELTRAINRPN